MIPTCVQAWNKTITLISSFSCMCLLNGEKYSIKLVVTFRFHFSFETYIIVSNLTWVKSVHYYICIVFYTSEKAYCFSFKSNDVILKGIRTSPYWIKRTSDSIILYTSLIVINCICLPENNDATAAIINERMTAGPANLLATSPVTTYMPVPRQEPTPREVKSMVFRHFCNQKNIIHDINVDLIYNS